MGTTLHPKVGRGLVQALLSSHFPVLQFRISEYAPINMVGVDQPRSPELQREGVAEQEDRGGPEGGGNAGTQQPGRSPLPGP